MNKKNLINMYFNIGLSCMIAFGVHAGNEVSATNSIYAMGDVDNNGIVDAVDSSGILVEYANLSTVGMTDFTDEQKKSADINNDGIIDSSDASYVLEYYAYTATGGGLEMNVWYNQNQFISEIRLSKYSMNLKVGDSDISEVTILPENVKNKELAWKSSDTKIADVAIDGTITGISQGTCTITVSSVNNPDIKADIEVNVTNRVEQINGITYINGILIVNKSYSLPSTYAPDIDSTTLQQFRLLSESASKEGLNIYLSSGYRSYSSQYTIYNNYVSWYGQQKADTFSARPGHSEHQTGLAIDVNSIDDSFAGTPEAIWLENHAHEFGFIIRYQKGKENITGYKYEPWHIRYLGVEKATDVYKSGLSLEEYLGIDSYYH